ncbi:hypothetical protein ANN_05766 [Periplaneta americana]|uniref:Uncharacterized protein n=1 Tax=Periplaneta americana TaxID=6978 RepID=A0ABQ8TDJ9_PERAM|nr:hypothetical protein ANN_05766 [Periplaneta americana]
MCRNFVPQEYFYMPVNLLTRACRSYAHLNTIDLARDRTRNLGHRRPALYQLTNQVDSRDIIKYFITLPAAPEAADTLDRPPLNIVERRWMASAMAPEADLLGEGVSPRTDRVAFEKFADAGIVYRFCRL